MSRRRLGVFLDPQEGPIAVELLQQFTNGRSEVVFMWRLDAVARERNLYTHLHWAKNLVLTDGPEISV